MMLTTIMKYIAITTLLASVLWRLPVNLQSYLDVVIAAGAVFALVQAVHLHKYGWAVAFVAIACAFNPIQPIRSSPGVVIALGITSMLFFAVSLRLLRATPRMTIASITEANPRTESL